MEVWDSFRNNLDVLGVILASPVKSEPKYILDWGILRLCFHPLTMVDFTEYIGGTEEGNEKELRQIEECAGHAFMLS